MNITDTDRIDFLDKHKACVTRDHKLRWWIQMTINTTLGGQKNLRDAIDSAIEDIRNGNY